MVMGPVCSVDGCHVMSRTEPASTFWSWVGTVMAAKPAVWAKTEEVNARTAAATNEYCILKLLSRKDLKSVTYQRIQKLEIDGEILGLK